ncbi:uncharacterized protein M421DRAFT_102184 [Didymella exigua CBS 183.55]|uniref:Lytic polysaccharide monooxygenase n=1 Tax=Didymella exigua CBS 183.55 TaxID=1150837 RepID=A0A6A5RI47_9PLEO|nr:uncharacterized protein M421DRAFT_102184 [Didymella exigua CBS 183.55]KAF1926764.1 hypothetical protein M421DRAFT_102184 [Didymella exigua CBS 183.55]
MHVTISVLSFLLFALGANASITQKNFTGIGNIFVLNSSDWRTASPTADKVGCLSEDGKFIAANGRAACGIFTRLDAFPYTLSTKKGNCTFNDESQDRNTDSKYGQSDHAWNCNATYASTIYDQLYTIDGFSQVYLCFGDVACYYDAKKVPARNEKLSLWQFHWGSGQLGITPGHVQLLLLWNKIGDSPKRKTMEDIPGPRLRLGDEVQIPLLGQKER